MADYELDVNVNTQALEKIQSLTSRGINIEGRVGAGGGTLAIFEEIKINLLSVISERLASIESLLGSGKVKVGSGTAGAKRSDEDSGRLLKEVSGNIKRMLIATIGVGSLIALIVHSSPALQGTLRLIQRSVELFIKPISDFIAFMLRPIVVALLVNFIIPFYRYVYPFFRDYGKRIGEFFAGYIDRETVFDVGQKISEFFENLGKGIIDFFVPLKSAEGFTGFNENLQSGVGELIGFFSSIRQNIQVLILPAWLSFISFWNKIINWFSGGFVEAINLGFGALVGLFSSIKQWFEVLIVNAWLGFVSFWFNVAGGIASVLEPVWSALVALFNYINEGIEQLKSIWDAIKSFFESIWNAIKSILPIKGIEPSGGIGGASAVTQNAVKNITVNVSANVSVNQDVDGVGRVVGRRIAEHVVDTLEELDVI